MSILLAQDMTGAHRMPLRWATDSNPGIARKRSGQGFSYLRPDGSRVRDVKTLARIRSLAGPAAGRMSGSAPIHSVTSRQTDATRAGASNTAITRGGATNTMLRSTTQ